MPGAGGALPKDTASKQAQQRQGLAGGAGRPGEGACRQFPVLSGRGQDTAQASWASWAFFTNCK